MWKILHGDVRRVLPTLEPDSFDAALFDPPYGLRFMGSRWDYDVPSASVFAGILQALKPGANAIIFGGTKTFHRVAVAAEDGGFEPRDMLLWLYGSGMPKTLNISLAMDKAAGATRKVIGTRRLSGSAAMTTKEKGGTYAANTSSAGRSIDVDITEPSTERAKQWEGYGTGLKPFVEPALLMRKFMAGTVIENAATHGCGGLNVGDSRIGTIKGNVTPEREGRWPSNVVVDEEAAAMLDSQAGNRPSKPFRANVAVGDVLPFKTRTAGGYDEDGGPSRFLHQTKWALVDSEIAEDVLRFHYTTKADRYQRNAGLESGESNGHPTIKPVDLIRYFARLILPPARETPRRILIPYAGVSSEMIGCLQAGWDEVIGIEREEEYIKIAEARIRKGGVFSGLMDRTMRTRTKRKG